MSHSQTRRTRSSVLASFNFSVKKVAPSDIGVQQKINIFMNICKHLYLIYVGFSSSGARERITCNGLPDHLQFRPLSVLLTQKWFPGVGGRRDVHAVPAPVPQRHVSVYPASSPQDQCGFRSTLVIQPNGGGYDYITGYPAVIGVVKSSQTAGLFPVAPRMFTYSCPPPRNAAGVT